MAMVAEILPERERGKALGLYMTIIGTGVIMGTVVGGPLVGSLGWRAVFLAVVPMGTVALVAAALLLRIAFVTALSRAFMLSSVFVFAASAISAVRR